jgi:Pentapeptide repeats (8 copies)
MLADLTKAKFMGLTVGVDLTGANLTSANFADVNLSSVRWDRGRMHGGYRGIRGIDSAYGNALFKRDVADQDYIDTLLLHWRGKKWHIFLGYVGGFLQTLVAASNVLQLLVFRLLLSTVQFIPIG